jgi:hypothetical protein
MYKRNYSKNIKETLEHRRMQEEIRKRTHLSVAILAEPMLKRRYDKFGTESMSNLVGYLNGQLEYKL